MSTAPERVAIGMRSRFVRQLNEVLLVAVAAKEIEST